MEEKEETFFVTVLTVQELSKLQLAETTVTYLIPFFTHSPNFLTFRSQGIDSKESILPTL